MNLHLKPVAPAGVPTVPAQGTPATPLTAEVAPLCLGNTGEAGGSPAPVSPTYSTRTVDCPDCQYPGERCETCWSTGEIDAVCVECERDEPLNAEGVCERCTDAGELPSAEYYAKHLHAQAMKSEVRL